MKDYKNEKITEKGAYDFIAKEIKNLLENESDDYVHENRILDKYDMDNFFNDGYLNLVFNWELYHEALNENGMNYEITDNPSGDIIRLDEKNQNKSF